MALTITTEATVRIMFRVENDVTGDVFNDALYFPQGQVPANPVLRSMAQDRYQAWRAIVTAPPRVPTLAEKVAMYLARKEERRRIQDELDGEDPAVVAAAD